MQHLQVKCAQVQLHLARQKTLLQLATWQCALSIFSALSLNLLLVALMLAGY